MPVMTACVRVEAGSSELRELAAGLQRDMRVACPAVEWDDIAGLYQAKHLLREAVLQPLQYPHLFTGICAPWKVKSPTPPPGAPSHPLPCFPRCQQPVCKPMWHPCDWNLGWIAHVVLQTPSIYSKACSKQMDKTGEVIPVPGVHVLPEQDNLPVFVHLHDCCWVRQCVVALHMMMRITAGSVPGLHWQPYVVGMQLTGG